MDSKIKLYKTAHSHIYNRFVKIVGVHFTDVGDPIFTCLVDGDRVLFTHRELTNFCL